MTGQIAKFGTKHCEDECDFPSSCHWKEQYAVQETEAAYIDTICLIDEPEASSIKSKVALPHESGSHMDEAGRSAGEHTGQAARENLSWLAEEDHNLSPCVETYPKLNGLGLHSLTMDLSSYKNGIIASREAIENPQIKLSTSKAPRMSAGVDSVRGDDGAMTGWVVENASESGSISPYAQPEANEVPFDFRLEQDNGIATCLEDEDDDDGYDEWLISRTGSALDWTVGGIGIALSPPDLPLEDVKMG